jgi:multiple sugar transport system substrate-binding protein
MFVGTAHAQVAELTMWSWASQAPTVVDAFNAENPDIKVTLVNPGAGPDLYLKLRNAMRAGSGVPDIAQVQFSMLPAFEITGSLTDLAPYGLDKYSADFIPWTWDALSNEGKVYSLPWDVGPVGMYYRKDIFEQYGLTVPTTWEEFEAQARRLREQTQDTYMSSAPFNMADFFPALVWQAGGRMFEINGTDVKITIDSPESQAVAEYWQRLIDDDLVATDAGYNTDWFAGMDAGKYATWIGPKWATNRLTAASSKGMGQWRIEKMPTWQPGEVASANWGGSVLMVPTGAPNAEAAAKFIEWALAGPGADLFVAQGMWPTKVSILESEAFKTQTHEVYGDQQVNLVFTEMANNIDNDYQYSPFQDFVDSQFTDELSAAAEGNGTLKEALARLQASVTQYAKDQGFNVVE